MKSVQIRSFFWSVFSCIQSKQRKIGTRKNSVFGHFSRSVINLLHNTQNQPSKLRTKIRIKINDESRGTYNKDNQIRFKTLKLRSSLCDYCNVYILAKGTITVANTAAQSQANNVVGKKVIFKNCALLTA